MWKTCVCDFDSLVTENERVRAVTIIRSFSNDDGRNGKENVT